MLLRIICPECGELLLEPDQGDMTRCSACEHGWELTSDHTQIKSVTLEVQNLVIDPDVILGARRING